jgi:hypothetical protein
MDHHGSTTGVPREYHGSSGLLEAAETSSGGVEGEKRSSACERAVSLSPLALQIVVNALLHVLARHSELGAALHTKDKA